MEARVEKAAGLGCDAIEPDNMMVRCNSTCQGDRVGIRLHNSLFVVLP